MIGNFRRTSFSAKLNNNKRIQNCEKTRRMSLWAGKILDKSGKTVERSSITAPALAIYFSAHWCPPCRMFTPKLAEFYKKANETEKKVEIIYISCDSTEEEYKEYYATMPWLTLAYDDSNREPLMETYGVSGIPALLVIDKDAKVKSKNGRGDVSSKGVDCLKDW